jgi:hypothetical protein
VSRSRPLLRVLIGLLVACGGVAAVVGGLYLRGSGLIALAITGALMGCLAAGITRESPAPRRGSPLDAAVLAGGGTMIAILVLTGTALLSSGIVAAIVGAALVGGGALAAVRYARRTRPVPAAAAPTVEPGAAEPGPVEALSTRALGRDWLRTNALLACALQPDARAALVLRRELTLDELERRDPGGFTRWLSHAGPESDPADYVHGERTAGTDAA